MDCRCLRSIIQGPSRAFTAPRVRTKRKPWRHLQTSWSHSAPHWMSIQGSDTRSKPLNSSAPNLFNRRKRISCKYFMTNNWIEQNFKGVWKLYFSPQPEMATWRMQRPSLSSWTTSWPGTMIWMTVERKRWDSCHAEKCWKSKQAQRFKSALNNML